MESSTLELKNAVRKDRNFFLTNVALGYWIVRRVEVRQGKESIVFTIHRSKDGSRGGEEQSLVGRKDRL